MCDERKVSVNILAVRKEGVPTTGLYALGEVGTAGVWAEAGVPGPPERQTHAPPTSREAVRRAPESVFTIAIVFPRTLGPGDPWEPDGTHRAPCGQCYLPSISTVKGVSSAMSMSL